jgi:hypothetical protein
VVPGIRGFGEKTGLVVGIAGLRPIQNRSAEFQRVDHNRAEEDENEDEEHDHEFPGLLIFRSLMTVFLVHKQLFRVASARRLNLLPPFGGPHIPTYVFYSVYVLKMRNLSKMFLDEL